MNHQNKPISTQFNLNAEGRQRRPSAVARNWRDQTARKTFLVITVLPLFLIAAVTIGLFIRSWPILTSYPLKDLFLGTVWKPNNGLFGFWPFITGTFWVTTVGVLLAVPPCLLVALYLSEYAHSLIRSIAKPLLDVLAAIPPVVYGVWGLLAVVPFVHNIMQPLLGPIGETIPLFSVNQPTGFSILAAGIVIAVMIAPLIISVVYEVFSTVPSDLRHASLAIGATQWETIRYVVIPRVFPGIVAGIVLGASRAVGETIAVLMVVGNVPKVPGSIFDAAYPLPALIANNYGDMMSIPLYDAALLCAALVLLVIILTFNIISTIILQRFIKEEPGMKKRWKRRHVVEAFVKAMMLASFIIVAACLGLILWTVITKGLPALNWDMVSKTPKGGFYMGKEGGVLNAIIGSAYLASGGTFLALLISLPIALYLQTYLGKSSWGRYVRLSLDVLWGIPSIVYGAFGFIFMLALGLRASLLAGIIVLALIELPIMVRAMDEVIRRMPADLEHAALALGSTKLEVALNVVSRQMLPGIITAVLLAFGRGVGDAASVLFTAGYTDRIPTSLFQPTASLPLAVFFQLSTPYPEVQQRGYASAVILTIIVLLVSLGSRWISGRLNKYTVK